MTNETDRAWHLDRRVPLALIIAIAGQTGAAIWFAASLEGRVSALEKSGAQIALDMIQAETAIHRVEMSAAGTKEKLNAILRSVERIERQFTGSK